MLKLNIKLLSCLFLILSLSLSSTFVFAGKEDGKYGINGKYQATVLDSFDLVQDAYKNLRSNDRRVTQCFDRAETWCHDMDETKNIKSLKVFIFFSTRFQLEMDKGETKWWFHVAPMVVGKNKVGLVEEFVFDRAFTETINEAKQRDLNEITTAGDWIEHFSKGKKCRMINSMKEYNDNEEKALKDQEYCYYRFTPMYSYEPNDIESCDLQEPATERTEWVDSEVKHAQLAFGKSNKKAFKYFLSRRGIRF